MLDNIEPRIGQFPLLEAKLSLVDDTLILEPSPDELVNFIQNLIKDVYHIGNLVPRVRNCQEGSYLVSLFYSIPISHQSTELEGREWKKVL